MHFKTAFAVLLFCILHFVINEQFIIRNGVNYCYTCFAKCFDHNQTLEECRPQCNVTESCVDLFGDWQPNSQTPSILNITQNHLNHQKVIVEWSHVNGTTVYMLQANTMGNLTQILSSSTNATVEINNCQQYYFRVAAINQESTGLFSQIKEFPEPIEIRSIPKLDLKLINIVNSQWNQSVLITVEYSYPNGLDKGLFEMEPVFNEPHLTFCTSYQHGEISLRKPTLDKNKMLVHYELPSSLVDDECKIVISVDKIKSKCGPNYATVAGDSTLLVNLTCNHIQNAICQKVNKVYSPVCYLDLSFTVINSNSSYENTSFVPVQLNWTSPTEMPSLIRYYLFNISQTEKPISTPSPFILGPPPIIHNFGLRKVSSNQSNQSNDKQTDNIFIFDDIFNLGKTYSIQMCAVYQQSTNEPIQWPIIRVTTVDLSETKKFLKQCDKNCSSANIVTVHRFIFSVVFILGVCQVLNW